MNSILPILSKDSKFPQYICIQFYCFTLDLLLFMFEAFFLCEHYVCLPNCTPYNKFLSNNNNNKKHPTSLWGLFFFIMPTFWRNDIFTIFPARNNLFIITSTFFFLKVYSKFCSFLQDKKKTCTWYKSQVFVPSRSQADPQRSSPATVPYTASRRCPSIYKYACKHRRHHTPGQSKLGWFITLLSFSGQRKTLLRVQIYFHTWGGGEGWIRSCRTLNW